MIVVAMLGPAGAIASSPTASEYQPIFHGSGGGGATGVLPFTGFEVGALAGAAGLLLLAGIALDRRARRSRA